MTKTAVAIHWDNGNVDDAFILPIKTAGTKGNSQAGTGTLTAKKIDEIGEPKEPKK